MFRVILELKYFNWYSYDLLKSQQTIYCLPTNDSTLRGRESKTTFVQERSSTLLKIVQALLGPGKCLTIDFIKLLIPSELQNFAINKYLYKHYFMA